MDQGADNKELPDSVSLYLTCQGAYLYESICKFAGSREPVLHGPVFIYGSLPLQIFRQRQVGDSITEERRPAMKTEDIKSFFLSATDSIAMSYIGFRRLIGILGMLLPFICIIGGALFAGMTVQPSISAYYHTNMRDFFVGLMFVVSLFLITYKGYATIDNAISTASGIAGLCIPIFPCLSETDPLHAVGIFQIGPSASNKIHLTFASVFFLLLAVNSIFLFTRTKPGRSMLTINKKIRNKIYVGCGAVILVCLLSTAVLLLWATPAFIKQYHVVLAFETIMLFAFGTSWLIKGETLFKD
jgi:hypothetical protein